MIWIIDTAIGDRGRYLVVWHDPIWMPGLDPRTPKAEPSFPGTKPKRMSRLDFQPGWGVWAASKPTNEKKVHLSRGQHDERWREKFQSVRTSKDHVGHYSPLHFILGWQNYNVGMSRYSRVKGILGTSHIVSCIVYPKNLVTIDYIVVNDKWTAFGWCEVQLVSVISEFKETWKQMVFWVGEQNPNWLC